MTPVWGLDTQGHEAAEGLSPGVRDKANDGRDQTSQFKAPCGARPGSLLAPLLGGEGESLVHAFTCYSVLPPCGLTERVSVIFHPQG